MDDDDEAELRRWIDKSLAYASSLPRKAAKEEEGADSPPTTKP